MPGRSVFIVCMLSCLMLLFICSCSDRTVLGASPSAGGPPQLWRQIEAQENSTVSSTMICCLAITKSGDVVWMETYDSIGGLEFTPPERQMKMLETYGVSVFYVDDLDPAGITSLSIDAMLDSAHALLLVTVTSGDVDDVPWSCIKLCAGSDDFASCVMACMGKRPSSGY